jgi:CheY-like chemotaxis protein
VVARMSADAQLRVVVADDDAFARRVIKHGLQAAGITVVAEASDGREAIELGLRHRPDAMVMDVVLPKLDGILATRRILQADPSQLVVLLTGAGEGELAPEAPTGWRSLVRPQGRRHRRAGSRARSGQARGACDLDRYRLERRPRAHARPAVDSDAAHL